MKKRVFIAGHKGMVGSAVLRKLKKSSDFEVITKDKEDCNLVNQGDVDNFFKETKIDLVILAAAKVGGISANSNFPADFIYENLMIESNIINAAFNNDIEKVTFLGSSCIYPKLSSQPIKEEYLLTDSLEPTNEAYAIAKIAGIKLCESFNEQYGTDFRSLMPTNLYGQFDNFNLENSHVIPGLIHKFHDAKVCKKKYVEVWGSGSPLREFLHVDDLADAIIFVNKISKEKYQEACGPSGNHLNVGSGTDISIRDLAKMISDIIGFKGEIVYDKSMPDGTPRKLLDCTKINKLGWNPLIGLPEGLNETYSWFLENEGNFRS
jgi:GDP-L-fucose synthase